jgi:hypothetical protein
MSAYDNEPSAVHATLAAVAETSTVSPPWRDALSRLTPDSKDEERLALYQAVRDSGRLFDDEGLYLVARQIECMVDVEAAAILHDLEGRMEAIARKSGLAEDERWPEDEVPPEYEKLSRQYQEQWDELYVNKLDAFGEVEIANLYRTDPDEFARRYENGLQFFQRPAEEEQAVSSDELVPVDSCLDPPHASLDQAALDIAGIPAALGNDCFIGWYWYYSNAVGGVKVLVRRGDARYARHVLSAARARPAESLPPWKCRSCGQRVYGQWDTCWRCGRRADDAPGEALPAQIDTEPYPKPGKAWKLSVLFCAAGLAGLVVILLTGNLKLPLLLAPLVCLCYVFLRQFEQSADSPEEETVEMREAPPAAVPRLHRNLSAAIVRRAWHASVFSLGFPPLGFYSMALLWKLGQRTTPLSIADQWRSWAAMVLSALAILYCLGLAGLVLYAAFR